MATLLWNGPATTDTWNSLNSQEYVPNKFSLYPTKTSGLIYTTTNTLSNHEIAVYNSLGQLVKSSNTNSSIDISRQSKGLYFISISRNNFSQTFKIIKQ
ncbi:T9SS type A sorting domain-containing protein [Flavobacterium sp. SM2513]|uniref:T9SS type A sorting domain-containing protein n=1 Tax=Flavobacterium sp. SM2513 TaxID=3424766 RepID=UPI003D7FE87B